MRARRERLDGPSTGRHSAEGLLDGGGAGRVPPNARPSLPPKVSPTAGTWTLPTDCAAALLGVGVRPSRSSSDRTGNQAVEQGERCGFYNVVEVAGVEPAPGLFGVRW
jgi:hypothetical protein